MVTAAVKQGGYALWCASKDLKGDKEEVTAAGERGASRSPRPPGPPAPGPPPGCCPAQVRQRISRTQVTATNPKRSWKAWEWEQVLLLLEAAWRQWSQGPPPTRRLGCTTDGCTAWPPRLRSLGIGKAGVGTAGVFGGGAAGGGAGLRVARAAPRLATRRCHAAAAAAAAATAAAAAAGGWLLLVAAVDAPGLAAALAA